MWEEYEARKAQNDVEEQKRVEQFYREHPYQNGSGGNQGSENHSRRLFSKWSDPNYKPRYSNNVLSAAASISMEPDPFVIQDWLLEKKVNMIVGHPNTGKTTVALALGAALSQGGKHPLWPSIRPNGDGGMIISSREDSGGTLKARYIAAGGDMGRFHILNEIPALNPAIYNNTRPINYSDQDYLILQNAIESIGDIRFMVLDPVSQAVRGRSGSKAKDRESYEILAKFAEKCGLAVLGVGHTPKTTKGKEIYARIAGSGAAGEVARSIIMVSKIKCGPLDDGATHIMVLAKSFGKPVNYGVTYSIVGCEVADENGNTFQTSKIKWHNTIPGTPEDILSWAESDDNVMVEGDRLMVAAEFLKESLRDGPLPAAEIKARAAVAGITTRDRDQAKKELCITPYKQKGAGQSSHWFWCLPGQNPN